MVTPEFAACLPHRASRCQHGRSDSAIISEFLAATATSSPATDAFVDAADELATISFAAISAHHMLLTMPCAGDDPSTTTEDTQSNEDDPVSLAVDHKKTSVALLLQMKMLSRLTEPWSFLRMPLCGISASQNLRTIFPTDRPPTSFSTKASCDALSFSLYVAHASLVARSLDDSFTEDEAIIATFLKALGPPEVCHIDTLPTTHQERSAVPTLPHLLGPKAILTSFTTQAFTPAILSIIAKQFPSFSASTPAGRRSFSASTPAGRRSFSASTPAGLPFGADTQASHKQKPTLPLTTSEATPLVIRSRLDEQPRSFLVSAPTSALDIHALHGQRPAHFLTCATDVQPFPFPAEADECNPFSTNIAPSNAWIQSPHLPNHNTEINVEINAEIRTSCRESLHQQFSKHTVPDILPSPSDVPYSDHKDNPCQTFVPCANSNIIGCCYQIPPIQCLLGIILFTEDNIPASDTAASADAVAPTHARVIPGFFLTLPDDDLLGTMIHDSLQALWYRPYLPSQATTLSSHFQETKVFISLLAADRDSTSYPPVIGDLNTHSHIRTCHGTLRLSAEYFKWPCGPMRRKLLHTAILAPVTTPSRPFASAVPISSNQAGLFFIPDKIPTILRQMCIAHAITKESHVTSFMKASRLLNVIYKPVTTYSSLDYSCPQCLTKKDKWTLDTAYQHFCRCRCPTHSSSKYSSQELIDNTIIHVIQRYLFFFLLILYADDGSDENQLRPFDPGILFQCSISQLGGVIDEGTSFPNAEQKNHRLTPPMTAKA